MINPILFPTRPITNSIPQGEYYNSAMGNSSTFFMIRTLSIAKVLGLEKMFGLVSYGERAPLDEIEANTRIISSLLNDRYVSCRLQKSTIGREFRKSRTLAKEIHHDWTGKVNQLSEEVRNKVREHGAHTGIFNLGGGGHIESHLELIQNLRDINFESRLAVLLRPEASDKLSTRIYDELIPELAQKNFANLHLVFQSFHGGDDYRMQDIRNALVLLALLTQRKPNSTVDILNHLSEISKFWKVEVVGEFNPLFSRRRLLLFREFVRHRDITPQVIADLCIRLGVDESSHLAVITNATGYEIQTGIEAYFDRTGKNPAQTYHFLLEKSPHENLVVAKISPFANEKKEVSVYG